MLFAQVGLAHLVVLEQKERL